MSDELIRKIYADCPTLFRHCSADNSGRPALPLYVEEGWLPLIYDLCSELEKLADGLRENGTIDDALPKILTIKQKYAQFRCHLSNGTDEMFECVEKYAWLATNICERCGIYGAKVRDLNKSYFVLCDECAEFRVKDMKMRLGH